MIYLRMSWSSSSTIFCTITETIAHGNLREYYRVKPLPEECRELTKKYLYGLSFVNYNMLVTNWDADNMEEILTPCMFEASEKGMDRRHLFSGRTGVPILFQWALAALRTGTGLFFAV